MAITHTVTQTKSNLDDVDYAAFLAAQEIINQACIDQLSETTVVPIPLLITLEMPSPLPPLPHPVSEEILSKLVESHAADGDNAHFRRDGHRWVFTIDPPTPKPMKRI